MKTSFDPNIIIRDNRTIYNNKCEDKENIYAALKNLYKKSLSSNMENREVKELNELEETGTSCDSRAICLLFFCCCWGCL